jgi:isopenicillin-N N-acyltransferase-like protein
MPFSYLEVSGTPFELGCQHGELAREQVRGFADYLLRTAGASRNRVLAATHRFLPLFQRHCPTLLEEARGLAEGARVTFEEALLLQIRGEIAGVLGAEGCTTFAVEGRHTTSGGILIGQTSDMAPELEQYFLVLRLTPSEGPRILMWTFAGQLGYHGLNEYGVAHFANSLAGGPLPATRPGGLPHYPVKRCLYECRTREEVLEHWRRLPVCSSGNYMLAAGDPAIFDVEATPAGMAVLEASEGFLAHANHFLSAEFRTPETDAQSLPDSFLRQERMTALLRARAGSIDVAALKAILSDHQHHPQSICRHEGPGTGRMSTVAGLIAEPGAGRLHVARGQPCRGDWATYQL